MAVLRIIGRFALHKLMCYCSSRYHWHIFISFTVPQVERGERNRFKLEAPGTSDHYAIIGGSFRSLRKSFDEGCHEEITDGRPGKTLSVRLRPLLGKAEQRRSGMFLISKEVSHNGKQKPGKQCGEV